MTSKQFEARLASMHPLDHSPSNLKGALVNVIDTIDTIRLYMDENKVAYTLSDLVAVYKCIEGHRLWLMKQEGWNEDGTLRTTNK
jgi:hypothetical protein